ncbi:glycosyltransferase family A protein [Streptacidiphilus sp. N1-10]|uniref:Glycosyltransferase family A protein n=1 Tax=Streptacidiphilus jeojiensis TaxID=3229225 RepID=A0ABV6XGM5_9ACTN
MPQTLTTSAPHPRPPLISVVVPTRDSPEQVDRLLTSLAAQDCAGVEVLVNDDRRSRRPLDEVVDRHRRQGLDVRLIRDNPTRAAGRRRGTAHTSAPLVLHLDSDMTAEPGLLRECRQLIEHQGYDALVIPEVSVGEGFWARCKVLEKRCHDGDARVESLRCLRRDLYQRIGGHDEELVWAEDRDLDLRARAARARVGLCTQVLLHHEGTITLRDTMRKKAHYARTADRFAAKHPQDFAAQASPRRLLTLGRRGWRESRNPVLVAGLVFLKACEYAAAGSTLLALRISRTVTR